MSKVAQWSRGNSHILYELSKPRGRTTKRDSLCYQTYVRLISDNEVAPRKMILQPNDTQDRDVRVFVIFFQRYLLLLYLDVPMLKKYFSTGSFQMERSYTTAKKEGYQHGRGGGIDQLIPRGCTKLSLTIPLWFRGSQQPAFTRFCMSVPSGLYRNRQYNFLAN